MSLFKSRTFFRGVLSILIQFNCVDANTQNKENNIENTMKLEEKIIYILLL